MEDDETVDTGKDEAGDESVVIDTSKTDTEKDTEDKDALQGGDEEAEESSEEESEEGDEGTEDGEKEEGIDFAAELEKMRSELAGLKPEEKKEESKKIYTKDELRNYRRQVEQKLEDGEINRAQHLAYIEQIEDLNEERLQAEADKRSDRKHSKNRAEENVTAWAETNAPELLDKRTKASKDSTAFGVRELGAVFEDGHMILPETVGRVLLGLAKGTQDPKTVKDAEARGRAKALKEKAVRDRDLKAGDKPPGDKSPSKKAASKLTAAEKDVQERLGLSPNAMKHYKRLRGHSDVEILQ
jgi:hypothetical protein